MTGNAIYPHALTHQQITNIRKRLERWELDHLRQHAAELAQRLELAEVQLAEARMNVEAAWDAADAWRENADQLALDITAMGAQVAMGTGANLWAQVDASEGVDIDRVHALHAVRGAA